jgi:DNA-binding transcriptional LysR family regulator
MRNLQIYRFVDAVARAGSIRRAAADLAITPSALNRRIQSLEEEIGAPIFERLGRGVRLSTAGEMLIDVFRRQIAEVEQVRSRIADLSGLRRGHVAVACSQALLPFFLPRQIAAYQRVFPAVTFRVQVKDGKEAEAALLEYSADIAIVFEPLRALNFQTIVTAPQPICAVMAREHPLAGRDQVRFSDCLDFPLALPAHPYAVRRMLETASDRLSTPLRPSVEAESYVLLRNFAAAGDAIAFELRIGVPPGQMGPDTVSRPLILPDRAEGLLHLAQLRGRPLSVAAARFADQIAETLHADEA